MPAIKNRQLSNIWPKAIILIIDNDIRYIVLRFLLLVMYVVKINIFILRYICMYITIYNIIINYDSYTIIFIVYEIL